MALSLEYRGCAYQGWERQHNGPTVQAALEEALSRVAAQPVRTFCAGRTDARVHAFGQVVHFDAPAPRPMRAWVLGTNTHLPDDISVAWAVPVDDAFHARFSARARRYRYIIYNARSRPGVLHGAVTWVHRDLDAPRMHEAARALLGEHDFSAYRATGCQARTPVRRLFECRVTRRGAFVCLDVCANAFLQHMVRNIAGVLIAIGAGERPVAWAGEVLAARQRAAGGVTAPPEGLYLLSVRYAGHFGLPVVSPPRGLW